MVGLRIIVAGNNSVHVKNAAVVARDNVVVTFDDKFVADRTLICRRRSFGRLVTDVNDTAVRDTTLDGELNRIGARFFVALGKRRNAVED